MQNSSLYSAKGWACFYPSGNRQRHEMEIECYICEQRICFIIKRERCGGLFSTVIQKSTCDTEKMKR